MPALKADITIVIRVREKSFSIGGVRLVGKKYAIKRGRSWSDKRPMASLSEIFAEARRWVVANS